MSVSNSAKKPELLRRFNKKVFGWKIEKREEPVGYWLITTDEEDGPGINGGLSRRTDAGSSTVNTIDITSVDEFAIKVEKNGGTIVTPKHAVPGVGYMVYFKDPKRNVLGMMEEDSSASLNKHKTR